MYELILVNYTLVCERIDKGVVGGGGGNHLSGDMM